MVGRLSASNITDCVPVSSYVIGLSDRQAQADGAPAAIFQLDGHRRADGFWSLIHQALNKAGGEGLLHRFKSHLWRDPALCRGSPNNLPKVGLFGGLQRHATGLEIRFRKWTRRRNTYRPARRQTWGMHHKVSNLSACVTLM